MFVPRSADSHCFSLSQSPSRCFTYHTDLNYVFATTRSFNCQFSMPIPSQQYKIDSLTTLYGITQWAVTFKLSLGKIQGFGLGSRFLVWSLPTINLFSDFSETIVITTKHQKIIPYYIFVQYVKERFERTYIQ